jgi:transposase-like protein
MDDIDFRLTVNRDEATDICPNCDSTDVHYFGSVEDRTIYACQECGFDWSTYPNVKE